MSTIGELQTSVINLVSMLDWEANVDPNFHANRTLVPYETEFSRNHTGGDFIEKWIVYKSRAFSAKELVVAPGSSALIDEEDAYGVICVQGHGTIAGQPLSAITTVRINELTWDEYFVTADAAAAGVRIDNHDTRQPLIVLKHYGPGSTELDL